MYTSTNKNIFIGVRIYTPHERRERASERACVCVCVCVCVEGN